MTDAIPFPSQNPMGPTLSVTENALSDDQLEMLEALATLRRQIIHKRIVSLAAVTNILDDNNDCCTSTFFAGNLTAQLIGSVNILSTRLAREWDAASDCLDSSEFEGPAPEPDGDPQ